MTESSLPGSGLQYGIFQLPLERSYEEPVTPSLAKVCLYLRLSGFEVTLIQSRISRAQRGGVSAFPLVDACLQKFDCSQNRLFRNSSYRDVNRRLTLRQEIMLVTSRRKGTETATVHGLPVCTFGFHDCTPTELGNCDHGHPLLCSNIVRQFDRKTPTIFPDIR